MKVRETPLPGVLVVEPQIFRDDRGFFLETFSARRLAGTPVPQHFAQDNHSRSKQNVLRGLHYQLDRPQGKLIHVTRGKIFDVAVDIRRGSPTFAKWFGVALDDQSLTSLWIPEGFAHGFCVLSDVADVIYKCTVPYEPADDRGIPWNDPLIGIVWPVRNPLLSPKDAAYAPLSNDRDDLPLA
ncbi:MAG TPA: dTDP-4-dehydrorhamnose 3,5-epimerase [Rhodothermia bacterium]|nr:dTDP-4-dehydrorhamnose 3,5-epimerase [Rhodothermia bacterium]